MPAVQKTPAKGWKTVAHSATERVIHKEEPLLRSVKTNALDRSVIPKQFRVIFNSAPSERIAFVKQGVPTSRIDDLAKSMGISLSKMLDLVGLPKASFHRWSSGGKNLPVSESERVIGLMKLVGQVENMVAESGDPTGFDASKWVGNWIEESLPALGGRAPKEFLDTAEGQNLVSNLLSRIQSGTFS